MRLQKNAARLFVGHAKPNPKAVRHNGPGLRAVATMKSIHTCIGEFALHLHVYLGGFVCACFLKANAIELGSLQPAWDPSLHQHLGEARLLLGQWRVVLLWFL